MKKLLAILLIIGMLFAVSACNKDAQGNTEDSNASEIKWETLPDDEIVGAWTAADAVADEYVLFTPEGKLRIVTGTLFTEADIKFGVDGEGNKSAYTQGNYLYGQWTYTINDGVLTVKYPVYGEDAETPESFEDKIFNSVEYTPITLVADKDFKVNEALVGKWTNSTYADSYIFTEDGYVIYNQTIDNGMYLYEAEIRMTYKVVGDKVECSFYQTNSNKVATESYDYSIDGTKLILGESDYYLDGEGDPGVTTPAE